MLIAHQGKSPRIHPTAYVAPTALISGEVEIGAHCRILHGAVITAEGAAVTIGEHCLVMEQAVLRAAGGKQRSFPLVLGNHSLVGPHAYLVGCTIGQNCFIATGALVFNNARIKDNCTVTLQGIVHIGTTLEEGQHVPLQHIAIGTPARIFRPGETEAMMAALHKEGFKHVVLGMDLTKRGQEAIEEYRLGLERYTQALAAHQQDIILESAD
ncbi:gamma carbonic anhydrase family protein [Ktedonosporobacter rubrisoli]|nr:gamma carbonic anhydrase family protein [Ktedonosporobacter rubrisoli]